MGSGWPLGSRIVGRLGPYRPVVELADRPHAHLLLVDRARQPGLRAARVLRRHLAVRADVAAEFLRVGRALAAIDHPGVCRVHDTGTLASRQPYMVMDHLHGRDLGGMVAGPAERRHSTVIQIGRQLAGGLAAAHDAGLLHLDLTTDSAVLVGDDEPTVKISNFEVAAVMRRWMSSRTGGAASIVGAPAYWSPEAAKGSEVDRRSDVYSLGVILFELLTGRVPFRARSVDDLIAQHVYAEVPALEAAGREPPPPRALGSIVRRCLAKDPADRFQSAHEVGAALRSIAGREGSRIVPGSGARPRSRPASPPSSLAWRSRMVIGFLAAAIALTVGLWTARSSGEPAHGSAPGRVRIAVTSEPAGALVVRSDGGAELGTTPLTLRVPRSDRPLDLEVQFRDGRRQRLRAVPVRSLSLHAGRTR